MGARSFCFAFIPLRFVALGTSAFLLIVGILSAAGAFVLFPEFRAYSLSHSTSAASLGPITDDILCVVCVAFYVSIANGEVGQKAVVVIAGVFYAFVALSSIVGYVQSSAHAFRTLADLFR